MIENNENVKTPIVDDDVAITAEMDYYLNHFSGKSCYRVLEQEMAAGAA